MPKEGEKFEFSTKTTMPTSFDLSEVDEKPYNFSFASENGEALNFDLMKSSSEVRFGMSLEDAKNSTIDFFNDGILVGSFPATDFPQYQTNVHPGVIIAAIVVACCVKVKYKRTKTVTVNGQTSTTTTWEVGWDCNCLSIDLRTGQPPKAKIIVKGKELEFDNFTITNNSKFNERDYSLILSH